MSSCNPRNWNSKRRATDIIQIDGVHEPDGAGLAAVLPANADFEVWFGLPAPLDSYGHESTHTLLVEDFEGVVFEHFPLVVQRQEGIFRVLAAETENRLGQIVRAE